MFLEVTSSCAEVVTLCATEISFSCMGYHVFFEGTSLCAGLVTLRAIKRLFSTVNRTVNRTVSRTACSCEASFYHVEACVFLGQVITLITNRAVWGQLKTAKN